MISKVETIRGTYDELEKYCNGLIKPSATKTSTPVVGEKFYLNDKTFLQHFLLHLKINLQGFKCYHIWK